jgi:hypothetical protein
MGAWCGPAVGSSGIDIQCPEAASAPENPLGTLKPALASHNDAALEDILDDTALTTLPALAEAANETVIEDVDDAESADEGPTRRDRTPAITTRLPGVPESSLPSFRRQMHRTDI